MQEEGLSMGKIGNWYPPSRGYCPYCCCQKAFPNGVLACPSVEENANVTH